MDFEDESLITYHLDEIHTEIEKQDDFNIEEMSYSEYYRYYEIVDKVLEKYNLSLHYLAKEAYIDEVICSYSINTDFIDNLNRIYNEED